MRHDYQLLIKESPEDLLELEKRHRSSTIGSRIRMLRLLKQGEASSVNEAAHLIGYSWRHAQRWLSSYRQHGMDELLKAPKKRPGRPELMTPAAWDALNTALANDEISTYRDAWEVLAQHGVSYASENGVQRLFKRHKIKAKTGRYQHEKNDPAVANAFKKTSRAF